MTGGIIGYFSSCCLKIPYQNDLRKGLTWNQFESWVHQGSGVTVRED